MRNAFLAGTNFLFIRGTRGEVICTGREYLTVGCLTYSVDEWLLRYQEIGEEEGYSEEEIAEYKLYIELADKRFPGGGAHENNS